MERLLMKRLTAWKASPHRKPLILNGARQVGKTWLLKEFGQRAFDHVAYVSLDNDEAACELFRHGYDVRRILSGISLLSGVPVNPHDTLVVVDEIQSEPRAITALKYFCENAREYAVAAAGSLLGISATAGTGYPVGKVNTFNLHPLSFREFLLATDRAPFAEAIAEGDKELLGIFSQRFVEALRAYYVVGGMPDAAAAYAEGATFDEVRAIQEQILEDYQRDFAKHVPLRMLQNTVDAWRSIPAHLAQENKKFVFGRIRSGSRAKDYEESLLWLEQAGLITRVRRVSKPGMPLSAYDDGRAFKVFMLDVGLMGGMAGLNPSAVVEGSRVFTEFKGALAEQYVCQQLISDCELTPYYWSAENSRGEIDFLVQDGGAIYPIEVKAEENLRAKSLSAFNAKYEGVRCRRFSLSGFRDEGWMRNVPLYAIGNKDVWEEG